jgi:hypothetical protein
LKIYTNAWKKKAERATGKDKRGLESPPVPGEEKEGLLAQGLL